jgi:hypothetical protein
MPVSDANAHHRAQLAARTRWGGNTTDPAVALEQAAVDRHIDELVKLAPRMTPEQADRIRRIFTYGPAAG